MTSFDVKLIEMLALDVKPHPLEVKARRIPLLERLSDPHGH